MTERLNQKNCQVGDLIKRVTMSAYPLEFGEKGKIYEVIDVCNSGVAVIDKHKHGSFSAFVMYRKGGRKIEIDEELFII